MTINAYKLAVYNEEAEETRVYEVQTDRPMDRRMLMVVGLVLDGGLPAHMVPSMVTTAQAHVDVVPVEGEHVYVQEPWIDRAME